MPIDAAWHSKHRMPARATPAQRLEWHEAHAKHCACRPFTAATRAKLKREVARTGDAARAARLHAAVQRAVDRVGPSTERASKSQIAFRRRRAFAWTWQPKQYLGPGGAPLVLSISLGRRDRSRRWKEVVEPSPGRFMHHLELNRVADVDGQVRKWLAEAWESAG